MKKLFILIIISLIWACRKDTDPDPTPEPNPTYFTFNGLIGTNDNSTLVSSDNNLVICGNSGTNLSILKITKAGSEIWRKDFTAGNNSFASAITQSPGRDLFICGRTSRNFSVSDWDILLVKTNSSGDTVWTKTYGGADEDYGYEVINTIDGNILLCGISYSFPPQSFADIYLIKVNYNGDTLWTRTFPDQDQEIPFHLMETQNGEYLVSGTNEDNSNPGGLFLLKVDASGNQLWKTTIGAGTWIWGYSTIELTSGDLLTCGYHTSIGYSQVLLLKTDNGGNEIWQREFGESSLSEKGYSIKQNSDGTFTITGSSYDVSTMQTDNR